MLAYLRNCSNKNFGRKEMMLYLAVLKIKENIIYQTLYKKPKVAEDNNLSKINKSAMRP